ncbi:hypothetical protein GDO81_018237 [Engystomops pustulosus]|uniref:NTR domain-containing protein n=2 Tax=Engystomops pustulosus TaxID=76066 RepID=A0AAV7ABH7_ENGPU|nr:hypothetical protein GDO81_018237 [Engystomops pustulosus]
MQSSTVQYLIKVLKVFKGFEKGNIHSVYTASQSATCGITLELKKEYLIAGHFQNGNVHISLCGLVTPWDTLSQFQIKMLTQTDVGYLQGCLCKIKNCARESCNIHERNVCHWPDSKNMIRDTEHACIKKRDGSCSWHPALPDKSEFNTHP